MTNAPTWLEYATAIGAIATPVLVLILSGIGWGIRHRLERRFELEEKLREDRIAIYSEILEPFIILFTSDEAWKSDPKHKNRNKMQVAIQKMLSVDYRERGFRLSLMGSDSVVRAYNNLMQFFFLRGDLGSPPDREDIKEMMSLVGSFLLEIRRSMGNETTKLTNWEMLEWFLSDARQYR